MRLVHQRTAFLQRLFGIEHEGQRLVVDLDGFGGVFGLRAVSATTAATHSPE